MPSFGIWHILFLVRCLFGPNSINNHSINYTFFRAKKWHFYMKYFVHWKCWCSVPITASLKWDMFLYPNVRFQSSRPSQAIANFWVKRGSITTSAIILISIFKRVLCAALNERRRLYYYFTNTVYVTLIRWTLLPQFLQIHT